MPRVAHAVERLEDRFPVYRVGNDDPVTLIQLTQITTFGNGNFGSMDDFVQADVFLDGREPRVSAIRVEGSPDTVDKLESEPSKMRMQYFGRCALFDLGIFHPGVVEVLNFAKALPED